MAKSARSPNAWLMTGKERKNILIHSKYFPLLSQNSFNLSEISSERIRLIIKIQKRLKYWKNKRYERSLEIDKEIEEEIKEMKALKSLVMTRRFNYL